MRLNINSVRTSSMRAASVLTERLKTFSGALNQFSGKRELYDVLGYKKSPNFDDYWESYQRDDIAGRIVDAPAKATWRGSPRIVMNEDKPDETPNSRFNREWSKLSKRLGLMHVFERADRLAGIGRYSVMLVGTRGGGGLADPIRNVRSQDDVLYVTPYSEKNAEIIEYETDAGSERFGLPKFYSISLFSDDFTKQSPTGRVTPIALRNQRVHHSHVIHIAENLLEDNVFGEPRLQRVFNRLFDLAKVAGGSAEFYWILANRGLNVNVDADAEMSPDEEADLAEEVDKFFHGVQRYILTRGVTVNPLGSDSSDPRGVFNILISLIAGATGIPQRVLLGSEQGKLASTEDKNNWNERVLERQKDFGEDQVIRPFFKMLTEIGALPELPDSYGVVWPKLESMTEKEAAEVVARLGQGIVNVSNQKQTIVTPEEFRRHALSSWELPPRPEGTDISNPDNPEGPGNIDTAPR